MADAQTQTVEYQWAYSIMDSSRVSTFLISMLLIVYGSFRSLNMEQEARDRANGSTNCLLNPGTQVTANGAHLFLFLFLCAKIVLGANREQCTNFRYNAGVVPPIGRQYFPISHVFFLRFNANAVCYLYSKYVVSTTIELFFNLLFCFSNCDCSFSFFTVTNVSVYNKTLFGW